MPSPSVSPPTLASVLSQPGAQAIIGSHLGAMSYGHLRRVSRAVRAALPAPRVLAGELPCGLAPYQQRLAVLGAAREHPALCAMLAGARAERVDSEGRSQAQGPFLACGADMWADAGLNAWRDVYVDRWRPLFGLVRDLVNRVQWLTRSRDRRWPLGRLQGQCPLASPLRIGPLHAVDTHYLLINVADLSEWRLAQALHCLRLSPLWGTDDQLAFKRLLASVLAYRLMELLLRHPLPAISPAALSALQAEHWEFLERGRMVARWLPAVPGGIEADRLTC
jgi:hypothetical protein